MVHAKTPFIMEDNVAKLLSVGEQKWKDPWY